MLSKEAHYNHVIDWAGGRIDHLLNRSRACKTKNKKVEHRLNAQALEEEFFDWFAARHSDSSQSVLFIPYHKIHKKRGKST
jgi:hypothetical protein